MQMRNHVIKSLATNPDIPMKAVQDQIQKQFEPCQILTAVRIDANNGIYPVAYAIVEAESKASWCWFLNLLREDLGIETNFNYTFIFDRQKGLIQAIATKATSEGEFKKKMGELKSFNSDAYDWLMKIPLEQWSKAYFLGRAKLVESRTVIIPPLYKPPIGRPPKKRKKSNDEIASQSASSGKLSRKGKSVMVNVAMWVITGKAAGVKVVVLVKLVFGQAVSAINVSGQAVGAKKVAGQDADARKASSQPSSAQSTTKQGPRQGFRRQIAGLASGSQRKTKKLVDL
ncbi:mutator type transposase [Tanacetum coccineum]